MHWTMASHFCFADVGLPGAGSEMDALLWFATSSVASTYANSAFLRAFAGHGTALTLLRFEGSALLGLATLALAQWQWGGGKGGSRGAVTRAAVRDAFVPAACLVGANFFNSLSLAAAGITITYVTKAAIPLVTVALVWISGERPTAVVLSTLVPITAGVALAAWSDAQFSWMGFAAAVASTVAQAALNVSSKRTMKRHGLSPEETQLVLVVYATFMTGFLALGLATSNPVEMERWSFLFETVMAATTPPLSIIPPTASEALRNPVFILVLAPVAYHVEYVLNFRVTQQTSEISFAVLDVMRRLAIILVGSLMFDKELTFLNVVGAVVALLGTLLYTFARTKPPASSSSSSSSSSNKAKAE